MCCCRRHSATAVTADAVTFAVSLLLAHLLTLLLLPLLLLLQPSVLTSSSIPKHCCYYTFYYFHIDLAKPCLVPFVPGNVDIQALQAALPHMAAVLTTNTQKVPSGMFGTAKAAKLARRSIAHLPSLISSPVPNSHPYNLPKLLRASAA
jgi:hypothetical protein